MPLAFRVLKSIDELELFTKLSCELVGNQIPIAYFKTGRVVGAFLGKQMVGGWAISYPAFGKLRCLAALPYDASLNQEMTELMDKAQLCEFTQLWLDPAAVNSRQSIDFWRKIAKDVLVNAAPYILFGFKAQNTGLTNLYMRLSPRILYNGPISGAANLNTHSLVTIMLLPRKNFRFLVLRNLGEAVRRLFRSKRGDRYLVKKPALDRIGTAHELGKLESKPG